MFTITVDSKLVTDGLTRLQRKALQAAVEVGLADSAAGRYTDFTSSQSLTAHLQSLAAKAIASA